MKRFGEAERVEKLVKERPERVILASDLMVSDMTLRYIGRFDSFDNIKAQDGDFVYMNGCVYLYKGGKWYELVDDIPHPLYGYETKY